MSSESLAKKQLAITVEMTDGERITDIMRNLLRLFDQAIGTMYPRNSLRWVGTSTYSVRGKRGSDILIASMGVSEPQKGTNIYEYELRAETVLSGQKIHKSYMQATLTVNGVTPVSGGAKIYVSDEMVVGMAYGRDCNTLKGGWVVTGEKVWAAKSEIELGLLPSTRSELACDIIHHFINKRDVKLKNEYSRSIMSLFDIDEDEDEAATEAALTESDIDIFKAMHRIAVNGGYEGFSFDSEDSDEDYVSGLVDWIVDKRAELSLIEGNS